MPQIPANGIQLEYESQGDPAAPPVLLIMGLGAQLTRWPEAFVRGLVEGGYRVIRFDNRDIGLSSKITGAAPVSIGRAAVRALLGRPGNPPYTLDDMARDTVGLLDALQLRSAHVIGVSMGGMIGQLMAARHGDRMRSFVSIMSTSGSRQLPRPGLGLSFMLARPTPTGGRTPRIERTMDTLRRIGSATYPRDEVELRAQVTRDYDRNADLFGDRRQLAAVLGSPSRLPLLPTIRTPTLIVHGTDDPLVPVPAAYDLQRRIPGAQLEIIPGMGHELPKPVIPRVLARILTHFRAAEPPAK